MPDGKEKTMVKTIDKPTVSPSQDDTQAGGNSPLPAIGTGDNVTTLPVSHIGTGPAKGAAKRNIFNMAAAEVSEKVERKIATMQVVRQRLAQAADLFKEGGDKSSEATAIADNAAVLLYQARAAGTVSAEEASGALGDIFGYKAKKDGTPGKTPDGQGEAIRKRVVRAIQARQFLNGEDGGRFFDGMPPEPVQAIVDRLDSEDENNRLSIWSAYDQFAAIKRENAERTIPAFDPKRVAQMVEELSKEGAADILRSSPDLVKAYGALIDVLNVVGEAAASEA
jgi:hypothetical protein